MLSVSSASILFQYTTADPLVVAFYRLTFSVLILTVPLLMGRRGRMAVRDIWLSALSGLFLAAHFATWFFSLKMTSIASSTILVSTHPLVVLLYGYLFNGKRTGGLAFLGVVLAVLGASLVGWGDFSLSGQALLGDLLAFLGAVAVSGYFLIGRDVRQRVDAVRYSVIAYGSAALCLLGAALLRRSQITGFEPANWGIFAALALFPTIFGHTLFNWALRHLPSSIVSVTILGEPVGATLLAWAIFGAAPGLVTLLGGFLILIGIGLFLFFHRP